MKLYRVNTKQISDSDLQDELEMSQVVLVDCFTPQCGPCKKLGLILDKMEDVYIIKLMFLMR